MPFYEYECPSCKFYAEVLQKISDKPLKKCSSCGKAGFKRLMSAPVFRLKGSGWYETDFKGDKDNQRNLVAAEREEPKPSTDEKSGDKVADKAETKTETQVDGKADGKVDAKTEAKADSKTEAKSEKKAASVTPAKKRAVKRPVRPARAKRRR